MKLFHQLSGLILLCTLAIGCINSADDAQPINNSKDAYPEILTSKHWKITKMEAVPAFRDPDSGKMISDLMIELLENCEMDDLLLFHENGITATDPGDQSCDFDEIKETGHWKLIFGNTKLQVIDLEGVSMVYDIDEMNPKQIKLRSSAMLNKLSTAKIVFEAVE